MAVRKINHLWENGEIDEENRKELSNPCSDVSFPLDKETRREINDLVDTFLADESSVGLAAPQIGVTKRFFVFDPQYPANKKKARETAIVIVNPKTVPHRNDMAWLEEAKPGDLIWDAEGCLSLPEISTRVPRLKQIKLKGFDINGKRLSMKFEDYPARIVQHEMDHLFGRLIVDYGEDVFVEKSKTSMFSSLLNGIRGK